MSNSEDYVIDSGDNIRIKFDDGLHVDKEYRLNQDQDGYFHLSLYNKEGQSIQRITAQLLNGSQVVTTLTSGRKHTIDWESNLYWWILEGDTVANVTQTYFNPFTGELQYVNLPPILNWEEQLVPIVNGTSITSEVTGRFSTSIAPIYSMKGDTIVLEARYIHPITKSRVGDNSFDIIDYKEIVEQVSIILD